MKSAHKLSRLLLSLANAQWGETGIKIEGELYAVIFGDDG